MKTLYLDCNMGATGEMLASALLAIHPNQNQVIERLNQLNLPGIRFQAESVATGGLVGTHIKILRDSAVFKEDSLASGSQRFSSPQSLFLDSCSYQNLMGDLSENCPEKIQEGVQAVFRLIAEAKSAVCGQPIEPIESMESIGAKADLPMNDSDLGDENETGTGSRSRVQEGGNGVWKVENKTAIAEVIAVCVLMDELKPEKVVASCVQVGSGVERRDHGFFPIPSPEVAWMLRGVPTYGGQIQQIQADRIQADWIQADWTQKDQIQKDQIQKEVCDLTGAGLLKHFVQEFGSQPRMRVEEIGYGFAFANSLNTGDTGMRIVADTGIVMRAMMGESAAHEDSVLELCCNLDDMTPERIGFAMEELFLAGALDVYTTPIGMKKNRPAVLLICMCRVELRERMIKLLFLHTTTLGIREKVCNRYVMKRFMETVETEYGPVRIKHVSGWGVEREKAEYDDLVRIARQQNLSIAQVDDLVKKRRDLDKKS